jgi:hypothetical protein
MIKINACTISTSIATAATEKLVLECLRRLRNLELQADGDDREMEQAKKVAWQAGMTGRLPCPAERI